jgi:hypothetical protein
LEKVCCCTFASHKATPFVLWHVAEQRPLVALLRPPAVSCGIPFLLSHGNSNGKREAGDFSPTFSKHFALLSGAFGEGMLCIFAKPDEMGAFPSHFCSAIFAGQEAPSL